MSRRRRPTSLRVVLLVLAVLVLGIIIIRSLTAFSASSDTAASPAPNLTELPTFDARELLERESSPSPMADDLESIIETPADKWANAVLDQVLLLIGESSERLSWWGTETVIGALIWQEDQVMLDQSAIELSDQYTLEIAILHHETTHVIARAAPNQGALLLTLSSASQEASWLLSNASPLLALKALIVQADARGILFRAAYLEEPRSAAQIVLLEAQSGISEPLTATPTHWRTPAPTSIMPTATRVFDPNLGNLVGKYLDPAINQVIGLDPSVRQAFIERHPWTGVFAASETDIRIGGRVVPIERATELAFYLLEDGETSENVKRLFSAVFTEQGTTRFPDDQVFFQAHRMKEVLYWAALRAAEENGQLVVAFDDLGTRQAITIIGFRPFEN